MMNPMPPQGMDTGMNPEMLMKLLQGQQMQQGLSSTGQMNARDMPAQSAAPVPTPGTVSSWVPPAARFDQSAQPGLASIAPKNIPQVEPTPAINMATPPPMTRGTMGTQPPLPSRGLEASPSPLMQVYNAKRQVQ